VGHDVTYSGTLAADMEAAILCLPRFTCSIDFPSGHQGTKDSSTVACVAASVARQMLTKPMPEKFILNVNIPYGSREDIRVIAVTGLGLRIYHDALV